MAFDAPRAKIREDAVVRSVPMRQGNPIFSKRLA